MVPFKWPWVTFSPNFKVTLRNRIAGLSRCIFCLIYYSLLLTSLLLDDAGVFWVRLLATGHKMTCHLHNVCGGWRRCRLAIAHDVIWALCTLVNYYHNIAAATATAAAAAVVLGDERSFTWCRLLYLQYVRRRTGLMYCHLMSMPTFL